MSNRRCERSPHERLRELIKQVVLEVIANSPGMIQDVNEFDIDQTAIFLNLEKRTVYNLVCARKITSVKRGHKLFFKKQDLIDYTNSKTATRRVKSGTKKNSQGSLRASNNAVPINSR